MLNIGIVFLDQDPLWHTGQGKANYFNFIFCFEGRAHYELNSNPLMMDKGDILFFPVGTIVKGEHDPASNCQKYKVLFKVPAQAEISLPILLAPAIRKIKACNFEYYKHRFSSLYRQWIGKSEYYQLMCASVLLEMLVSFNREMDTGTSSIRKLHLVETIKDYIQRHMDQPVSLEQLSKFTNESPHYIIRAFRELTGQTPVQYLHYIRICSADELLLHSNMKLTEIALYLGYCDQAHFSRTYKRISGRTPLQTIALHSSTL